MRNMSVCIAAGTFTSSSSSSICEAEGSFMGRYSCYSHVHTFLQTSMIIIIEHTDKGKGFPARFRKNFPKNIRGCCAMANSPFVWIGMLYARISIQIRL